MSTVVKRLRELNLRQIFVISTILSVVIVSALSTSSNFECLQLVSLVLISMGFVEIAMDQYYTAAKGNTIATHLFISLFIFCACNILILLHVIYITQYVLKVRTTTSNTNYTLIRSSRDSDTTGTLVVTTSLTSFGKSFQFVVYSVNTIICNIQWLYIF
jgi:hypothetical protein